jgi:hypothetical protein
MLLSYTICKRSKLARKIILCVLEKLNILKIFTPPDLLNIIKNNECLQKSNRDLKKIRICVIYTYSSFYQKVPYYQMFVLNKEMQDKVNNETKFFSDSTIGVHIRRTDNLRSIRYSPIEAFISEMENLVNSNAEVNFYVASDDMEVKEKLKEKFGEKIILPQGELSRNTKEGIRQAVVELYALSRTSKILGSYYSSYSSAAAEIGNIELQVVR